jgi:oxygen-dependent protoporphyrinogen oxidase
LPNVQDSTKPRSAGGDVRAARPGHRARDASGTARTASAVAGREPGVGDAAARDAAARIPAIRNGAAPDRAAGDGELGPSAAHEGSRERSQEEDARPIDPTARTKASEPRASEQGDPVTAATVPMPEPRPSPDPGSPVDDLLVVGGGPAGLARAFWERRERPDARIRVLEAAGRPGGWMQTERHEGYLLERGPQTVRGCVELDALIAALGLDDDVRIARPEAKVRWLARRDRLRKLPGGPLGLFTSSFLPLGARLRLLLEPFARAQRPAPESETVSAFVARRLGKGAVGLVQAVVSGIHAADADRLEVQAAFPALAAFEREHGSLLRGALSRGRTARRARKAGEAPPRVRHRGIVGFDGGLQRLTDALVTAIGEDRIECDEPVDQATHGADGIWTLKTRDGSTYRGRRLVLAVRARRAAEILAPLDETLAEDLAQERLASVTSVWLGFPLDAAHGNPRMRGFGFLQHGDEPGPVLGCLYTGRLFPDAAPPGHGLVRAMLGGSRFEPSLKGLDDEAITRLADDRLRRLLGYDGPWSMTAVRRAVEAIPQYDLGHAARVARIRARVAEHHLDLELLGCSYEKIALPGQFGRPGV